MKRQIRWVLAAFALGMPLGLSGCTGTVDEGDPVRLALLLEGGKSLGYLDTRESATSTATPTVEGLQAIGDGQALHTLDGGRALALTRSSALEQRDATLKVTATWPALPTPSCLTQTAVSSDQSRLLTLSDCQGVQQIGMYNASGKLLWSGKLPAYAPPIPGNDVPTTQLAVLGEIGVVARPRVGGGSEVMRVSEPVTGQTTANVSTPQPTPTIRDLVTYNGQIYAATDNGVRPLSDTGVPDPQKKIEVFGETRYDRLWSDRLGSRELIAVWRNTNSQFFVWDGVRKEAAQGPYISNLRDVAFSKEGHMYTLNASTLSRHDAVMGLQQTSNWRSATVTAQLKEARALTWLYP